MNNLQPNRLLKPNEVFVFGSNLAGIHGSGAARDARLYYGAEIGVGVGPTGQCYALPTKDYKIETLPLPTVRFHVDRFLNYARMSPNLIFLVSAVGCGLAGFNAHQIAPMFAGRSFNVKLPMQFIRVLYPKLPDEKTLQDIVSFMD